LRVGASAGGCGVLYIAGVEVLDRDLCVLKRYGYLTNDDPTAVGKDEFETALASLQDGLARQLGILGARSGTPTNASV
jgi:hypothetical protein